MIQAFSNEELKSGLCGNCDCSGFVPVITFVYAPGTPSITFTEDSDLPVGDDLAAVNITVTDKDGNREQGQITVAGGNVVISLTGFNLGDKLDIIATVVTDGECTAEMSYYNLETGTTEGELNAN